jgi:hypothetical protein
MTPDRWAGRPPDHQPNLANWVSPGGFIAFQQQHPAQDFVVPL